MSEIKDTVLAIWEFLSKIVGDQHWIYVISLCMVSWLGYYLSNSFWFLLFAVFFSLILILTISTAIYFRIANRISNIKNKKRIIAKQYQDKLLQEKQTHEEEQKHASLIWHYVGHFKKDKIETAAIFLMFPIHDNNKYIRFIEKPDSRDWKRNDDYWKLYNVVPRFHFQRQYYQELCLLNRLDIEEGFYVEIEPYFYSLLENYKKNNKWEKL